MPESVPISNSNQASYANRPVPAHYSENPLDPGPVSGDITVNGLRRLIGLAPEPHLDMSQVKPSRTE